MSENKPEEPLIGLPMPCDPDTELFVIDGQPDTTIRPRRPEIPLEPPPRQPKPQPPSPEK